MKLAKVIGTVVATIKHPSIEGTKILMIQPLDENQNEIGEPLAAIDTVQAGPDDLVYWTLSRESTLALDEPFAPVDASITGIVDDIHVEDVGIHDKDKIFNPPKPGENK
ncbi:MAG: EutN/CcmL family microcompartment protein [Bacteriovoracaceae bacterium]|nr:EutN/CcmL family microcompartment protein [Bacteriovoracaceae bacterium]